MGRRRRLPPFEVEVLRLGPRGAGVGWAPDGRPVHVRGAPPGARVGVVPAGRRRGVWKGRRTHLVRPPADHVLPRCAVFGLCGGCVLQELDLPAQRRARAALAVAGLPAAARVHPPRGIEAAYGYRNKVELSFGARCYLSASDQAAGLPQQGRFLGFHAPGRFDRIVDAARCELVSEALNEVLAVVRAHTLHGEAPPCWAPRTHEGFFRHLLLREGQRTGQILVGLYTTTPDGPGAAAVEGLADALVDRVTGVLWFVNDSVADVARGTLHRRWGVERIEERLGDLRFALSAGSFFQTSAEGAELLYATVGEALGAGGATLVDLYCGTGALGLTLAAGYRSVVGIEEVEAAVVDARDTARRAGIEARYVVAKVEDALGELHGAPDIDIVVDPPRAGLHPRVARALAGTVARTLVYVACNPSSLVRDTAALAPGWRLTDVWPVDLFPQTGHVEVVGRFEPSP